MEDIIKVVIKKPVTPLEKRQHKLISKRRKYERRLFGHKIQIIIDWGRRITLQDSSFAVMFKKMQYLVDFHNNMRHIADSIKQMENHSSQPEVRA